MPVFCVPIEDNKVTILPHPVVYGTKLYFKNAANGRHTLRIFNLQGAQVFTCYSDTEYFNLDNLLETYASINAPQVVVYSIVNDANSITHTGKMILAHQF